MRKNNGNTSFAHVWAAYGLLIFFHILARVYGFQSVHRAVKRCKLSRRRSEDERRIVAAIDKACIYYFTQVRCLQYSAALVCLLRRHGIAGELVIGVVPRPFYAHAWVELGGAVLASTEANPRSFVVIERV